MSNTDKYIVEVIYPEPGKIYLRKDKFMTTRKAVATRYTQLQANMLARSLEKGAAVLGTKVLKVAS